MAQLGMPMAVRVAATLRVADHLVAGPSSAADLAPQVDADPDALNRLLRFLAKRGLFRADDQGRYRLTPQGEPLRSDHPSGVHQWLDLSDVGKAEVAFAQLLHSIRTGEAAYPVQHGRSMWDDLASDPSRADAFNESMSVQVPERGADIVGAYDWSTVGHVVDLGGGAGTTLIALLTAFPTLRGTVLDQAEATETARKAFATADLADRADAVTGSFFDPVPKAGGYLLSVVTHNWNDAAVERILRNCVEASGDDTAVFIAENVGVDGEHPPTGMDLRMLVYCGGKERMVSEIDVIARRVGLTVVGLHPAGSVSVVELRRAA